MPGQAARGGQPTRRIAAMPPSTRAPAVSRPRARAPGEYAAPALRIDTNADAQRTTVTPAAATALTCFVGIARTYAPDRSARAELTPVRVLAVGGRGGRHHQLEQHPAYLLGVENAAEPAHRVAQPLGDLALGRPGGLQR